MNKFYAILGNPPYQGENHQQIYPDFYLESQKSAENVELIFPTGWQEPKTANNLGKLNNEEVKADRQIVFIDNIHNAFSGVTGAEWTNIILWSNGYDNGLNGKQKILTEHTDAKYAQLIWNKKDIQKPSEIIELANIVMAANDFKPMQDITSVRKPYGLSTDVFKPFDENKQQTTMLDKYGLPELQQERIKTSDVKIYGLDGRTQAVKYVPNDYPFPRNNFGRDKYSVLIGKAWGNFSDSYLGGAYADIIVTLPNEVCTENFLESGQFDTFQEARCHAKYLMTKFCRALLYRNKNSQDNSRDKWISVPIQTYTEDWWVTDDIDELDSHLFDKYKVPQNIRKFVMKNIQTKTIANIINYSKE